MIRFYTVTAPAWWPFQVVSLANRRFPPKRYCFYYIIIDNGMFKFVKEGRKPDISLWVTKLKQLVYDVDRLRKPKEIVIILPDWLRDPSFTLEVARRYSRILCKDYKCMVVAHYNLKHDIRSVVYEILSIDGIELIGVPCKLYCSRQGKNRRVIRYECQKTLVELAYSVAKNRNKLHALGLGLKQDLIARVSKYISSFDTTSWTKPFSVTLPRHSAKNRSEREEFFKTVLSKLRKYIYIPHELEQVLLNAL